MKKGNIIREKKYGLGIVKDATDEYVEFIDIEKSNIIKIPKDKFSATFVKNIPAEVREFLKQKLKLADKKDVIKKQISILNEQINECSFEMEVVSKKITRKLGYVDQHEFISEFKKALPPNIASLIDEYYTVTFNSYGKKYIEINRDVDIEKYFRSGSFVYEEYDGTMAFIEDCEKDKNYQYYIARYRKPLPIKVKLTEYLQLGDKDWLSYLGYYIIDVKEELTIDYAKELAKKIV